jgi:hypothetical protein
MTERPRPDTNGAPQRYRQIQTEIPDRLDQLADELASCISLLARTGLLESLQPDPARHQAVPAQLRDAATRIRWAATLMPEPATWARTPVVPVPSHRDAAAEQSRHDLPRNLRS